VNISYTENLLHVQMQGKLDPCDTCLLSNDLGLNKHDVSSDVAVLWSKCHLTGHGT